MCSIKLRAPLVIRCNACNEELMSGHWLVGVETDAMRYVVGKLIQTRCCGRTARVMRPYGTATDAHNRALMIAAKIAEEGIASVILMPLHKKFDSNT